MADITLPYVPVDGATLVPDSLNQDLYSATPSVSIYETSNGSIELANFAAGFKVEAHQIRPWETGDARADGQLNSIDFFQDAWSKGEKWYPIAGCSYTWYQRYDVTIAALFASMFATVWRNPGPYSAGAYTSAPLIRVRTFLDDPTSNIGHTRRTLPQSVQYDPGVMPAVTVHTLESRVTRHFNILHPKVAGKSAPIGPLTQGWHTFGMAIYIDPNYDGRDTTDTNQRKNLNINGAGDDARPPAFYHALHRARIFVRNVTVLSLL